MVHDADGIPDRVMHPFARETRLSETSFVQSPEAGGADYRHRIWMPTGEIPFAGHPSLGTAVAVAQARGDTRAAFTQQTRAGLQPVEVEVAGDVWRAAMVQEPARFGPVLEPGAVLACAGLDAADADPELPCQVVFTGAWQVIAPVRDLGALGRARADHARIAPLLAEHDAIALYIAVPDPEAGTARARSFLATVAMGEDPATGAAAGPLCAYLAARTGVERLDITQGVEMGRPSLLRAALEDGRVRLGGDVVVVIEGTVRLDT